MPRIRVLIADDHAVLRAGLRMLIGLQPDLEVIAETADGPETVRRTRETKPDIVLLDLSMPGSSGMQTIEALVRIEPTPRVLVLTMHDDPAYLRSALLAGASGYIVKKAADVELLTAIRAVHRGRTFVNLKRPGEPPQRRDGVGATGELPGGAEPLKRLKQPSRREAAVLRLLAHGHTNQEAADRLAVSVKTIETYRKRLRDKLGLKTRAQLFRFAVASGMLEADAALPSDE